MNHNYDLVSLSFFPLVLLRFQILWHATQVISKIKPVCGQRSRKLPFISRFGETGFGWLAENRAVDQLRLHMYVLVFSVFL